MGRSSFVKAVLAPSAPGETTPVETKSFNEKAERPISGATRRPRAQNAEVRAFRETQPSLPNPPSLGRESSSSPAEATPVPHAEAVGPDGTALESGGIDIGSAGGSQSGKGTTPGRSGAAVDSASVTTGSRIGQHDTSGYRGAPGTRSEADFFNPPFPRLLLKFRLRSFVAHPSL
jgi:hypothetical protein